MSGHDLERWQKYTKYILGTSNSVIDERFNLAILELEVPYEDLGFATLGEFLLQVPKIGEELVDESNIFRKPTVVPIGLSRKIKHGDKISWLTPERNAMTGTVQWIGEIEGVLSAGLISDQRLGPDNRVLWNGTKLFSAPLGHGKIMPVRELVIKPVRGGESAASVLSTITKPIQNAAAGLGLTLPGRKKSEDYNSKGIQSLDLGSQSVKFNKESASAGKSPVVEKPGHGSTDIYPRAVEPLKADGLRVNDVIVWVTDNGAFDGIVMWLGKLRYGGDIYAGVDFQQNVGDTDGMYNDYQLFRCKPKQGKFIPIDYLVKYDDFHRKPVAIDTGNDSETKKSDTNLAGNKTEPGVTPTTMSSFNSGRPRNEVKTGMLIEIEDNTVPGQLNSLGIRPSAPTETEIQEFQIGDRVKYYPRPEQKLIGTIKWLGKIGVNDLAGIDFDEKTGLCVDKEDVFPFEFKPGHGGLAPLEKLEHCGPVEDIPAQNAEGYYQNSTMAKPPDDYNSTQNLDLKHPAFLNTFIEPCIGVGSFGRSIGFHQGIQGKNNSCYIDTTLFLLLAYTDAFDAVLLKDDPFSVSTVRHLKAILRTDIANQLRRNYYCSSENVNILRKALSGLCSRIRNSEMADIEEFLYTLFGQGLQLPKFIHYSSGVSEFVHQILLNPKDVNNVVTTQRILENSMFAQNNLKFLSAPSPGLFLALPRENGKLAHYKAVVPSVTIDITHLLHSSERRCTICSVEQGTLECLGCYDIIGNTGMSATAFCESCFQTFHNSESRQEHKRNVRPISSSNLSTGQAPTFQPTELHLVGVICIRESHYVSFVKCGPEPLAPWVMHNSMADAGIPEIRDVPGLGECLRGLEKDPSAVSRDWELYLPEIRRILEDIYFCVYSIHKTV